ncbi:MAG: hypothetical protein JNM17_22860 [Archangium sp.]|nr:hypothetical protein [Archangium sp.]
MRLILLFLVASVSACSQVDTCPTTCDGCCDARGFCRTDQAWACGKEGAKCTACEPGQRCQSGECFGASRPDRIEVVGSNSFAPLSAQAFRATGNDPRVRDFIAVSTITRQKCRDPYAFPAPDERVLIFSEQNGVVDPIALLSPADGGVRHESIAGNQGMSFGTDFARVDFDIANTRVVLNGTIEAPFCGQF